MSNFVKEIRTIVEQVVHDCNIPTRPKFPVNVISYSATFPPRACTIEVLITEEISAERINNFDRCLTERLGNIKARFGGSYWPPSGTNTGSLIYRITEA